MLDAFLELVPQAQVGYFGLERNEETAVARRYYEKVPADLGGAIVFLLDPMLATGGSAAMALEGLAGPGRPAGAPALDRGRAGGRGPLSAAMPDVEIYTAAVDRELNARKYILPGLGRLRRPAVRDVKSRVDDADTQAAPDEGAIPP